MKIIYLTDIHGAFEQVKDLLFETVADLYVVSGDLIDIPFYSMDTAITYHELQSYFHAMRRRMEHGDMIIEDFVDQLLEMPDVPDEIQEKGTKYQQYTIRARRVMQQKYKVLENIVSLKQGSQVLCLPGNYDMDLKYTSLHERDLHLHKYEIEGLLIAGYGGADIWSAGIPERYIVRYRAGIGTDDSENEMHRYFTEVRPDIIVTHQPAHGIHDRLSFVGPSGSPALRTFCDANPVLLCLTGHIHNDWGMEISEGTIHLNPSPFGEVTGITGDVLEGGFFHQIELEGRSVTKIDFRKMADGRIYDIVEYVRHRGKWTEKIIDSARLHALERKENYDSRIRKYSHIPEIRLFNEIKQFFRMFQTPETDERVDRLERVARLIEERINENIAMDIVGSVNVGLSQPSSDIDFVLYLRCGEECGSDLSSCENYRGARDLLEEALHGEYSFEIVDCVDLHAVERGIAERDYECETLQRFVAYRSICRPVNYRVIAPVEDMLNQDQEFRSEIEGSIRSYFKIFVTTSQHIRSFDKYELRLRHKGIKMPDYIRNKIKRYLQGMRREDR